ncbi:MAG TPA: FAD:protein FMN transferase [Anaerolineales bacterium]|nr:FAD:protein FMN transferase [Anaerolineales bacterium]
MLIDPVKQTRILMGMPVTLEVVEAAATEPLFNEVFTYFQYVDEKFSTYKDQSEISRLNRGDLKFDELSEDLKLILGLAEQTRRESNGYFDIHHHGILDPSGIVKGWAIYNAAEILHKRDFKDFYVEAGGDVQACGKNTEGRRWRVGIRNPFNMDEIVKVLSVTDCGVATSGTYVRGQHIYDPKKGEDAQSDILSLTVIGPDVYEADRFATAAFAMGRSGIDFIEDLPGFEGYMIDKAKQATYTTGFGRHVLSDPIR